MKKCRIPDELKRFTDPGIPSEGDEQPEGGNGAEPAPEGTEETGAMAD